MRLPRRTAITVGVVLGLIAGCSAKSNPGGNGIGGQGGGSVAADGAPADLVQDASPPTCRQTIDQYCRSDGASSDGASPDASTCLAGVARDWTTAKQQAASRCAESRNVFFQECATRVDGGIGTRYGVLNAAGVDGDTVFFYDLTTSMLVRVDQIQFGRPTECIAGINLEPVDCSVDGAAPVNVCTGSDGRTD